jgi:two-component system, NtrC family, sensor kinase
MRQIQRITGTVDWRLFAGRFLVASIVLVCLWQASLYIAAVVQNRQFETVVATSVTRAENSVSNRIAGYAADLMILSRNGRLRELAVGDVTKRQATIEDFKTFVSQKTDVAQLRFIDAQGQEVVRIDRTGANTVVVPRDELQSKRGRYYFENSVNLPIGMIYASPIDLNVEHGAIETPWRPMFRIATPVQPAGPESRGVVILNIDASKLLGEVRQAQPTDGHTIQLVNSDGYWLAGAPQEKLWGFMFGNDMTIAAENPDVWKNLSQGEAGEFDAGGEHYMFRTVSASQIFSAAGAVSPLETVDVAWTFFANVPEVTILSTWKWGNVPIAIGGLLITALITLSWTQSITARRRAEAEKQQAENEMMRNERLASLGGLVAGVAHELNTPIGSAVTIASTLAENASTFAQSVEAGQVRRSELDKFLRDMRTGTAMVQRNLERADGLIGHFKQVAVDQTSERLRDFQLDEYVEDVIGSIAPQFKGSAIEIRREIRAKGTLSTYPGPLAQVLINLITNVSNHAFDEGQEGVITISARDVNADEVEIVVRDNGKGIPEDHLDNIFEPFFTTRLGSGGSGLGLSIVYNIVENVLGGHITAASAAGKGTSMIIRIPRTVPAAQDSLREKPYHVDKRAA